VGLPVPDIPFPGYQIYDPIDPFEDHIGPMYYKRDGHGAHCLLPTRPEHLNSGAMVHGGLLMSFADYALATAAGALDDKFALTISLNCSFLNAGRLGPPLEARTRRVRSGKTVSFARGEILQEGNILLSATAVFRLIDRDRALSQRIEPATSAGVKLEAPPPDFKLVERNSPFLKHVGDSYVGERNGRRVVVQPTAPHMLNAGGPMHGGVLMNFADNAFCTEIGIATGGLAPITTSFSAEFLAAGKVGPLLSSAVELLRTTRTTAFVRGAVEQEGATLLLYDAVVTLKDRARLKEPT
jgi:uncharacterized protein (TIGR00369 family)